MAAAITAALAWIGAAIQPDLDAVPTTAINGDEVIEAGSLDYRQALMLICVAGLAGTAFSTPRYICAPISTRRGKNDHEI
ncbi:hypothetical protein [Novosphingobium sp. P6W]|uniref:hypothetical protein n=1 Tax=Novosphingobium sp. P6W TaxID=1609758 RepID=UPI0005C2BF5E|nr:hypothetical protein [Novosphingobium sp. P6W]AXB78795.1 hypothetical protein TQ38_019570 [Novosphingobium sp. P6W]KIS31792.1 hypothetical protein TQ38_15435 [Novosphingobium sp. P6W]